MRLSLPATDSDFVDRCVQNYLQLNVGKTKDIFDLRRNQREKSGTEIRGETDERVKL